MWKQAVWTRAESGADAQCRVKPQLRDTSKAIPDELAESKDLIFAEELASILLDRMRKENNAEMEEDLRTEF